MSTTVRFGQKQVTNRNEKPTRALLERGVQYVEIRSLDINPFSPFGISLEQIKFIEVLFVYCLLVNDDLIDRNEREEIDINAHEVSHQGRKPDLFLRRKGKSISVQAWLRDIFSDLEKIAECMDKSQPVNAYTQAIHAFAPGVDSVEETFSAKILNAMRDNKQSYYEYIEGLGKQYCQFYSNNDHLGDVENRISEQVTQSIAKQKSLEEADGVDFTTFLTDYFST